MQRFLQILCDEFIPSKRVIVNGGRFYGSTRCVSAQWPETGMHETENHHLFVSLTGPSILKQGIIHWVAMKAIFC